MERNEQALRKELPKQSLSHVLISIRPNYVESIINGNKRVEVRRRRVLIKPGSTIWIYATKPVASIVGFATVSRVDTDSAEKIWRDAGVKTGISKKTFSDYVRGASVVSAIHLTAIKKLKEAITLREIRTIVHGFHPPQFFNHLDSRHSLRVELEQYVA